jgi:hypothetical protein
LNGAALTVLASGFLDPSQNSSGPAFGLWVALPAGGNLIPLPISTGIENKSNSSSVSVYPNPAVDVLNIQLQNDLTENAMLNITDLAGRTVISQNISAAQGKNKVSIDISSLESGNYIARLISGSNLQNVSFVVAK